MMLRNLFLAFSLMCVSNGLLAADSSDTFAVKGAGLNKCSAFVEVVKGKDKVVLAHYIGWLEGFISASNQHIDMTFDLAPWQNVRTLILGLLNHCNRNADMRFGEAVVQMVASLLSDRLTEKSAILNFDLQGQQHGLYQEAMRRIQSKLAQQGLYAGEIDGQLSAATKLSLATFQTEHKLPATGLPDQKTLFVLLRIR